MSSAGELVLLNHQLLSCDCLKDIARFLGGGVFRAGDGFMTVDENLSKTFSHAEPISL